MDYNGKSFECYLQNRVPEKLLEKKTLSTNICKKYKIICDEKFLICLLRVVNLSEYFTTS